MRETWYILEDETVGDPAEVAPDDDGVLRHASGVAVAIGPHGPRSRGVYADAERARIEADKADADKKAASAKGGKAPKDTDASVKDVKPAENDAGYKTRDVKAG